MFNLVGLALTFGLCPLPLTFHRVNAVHLTEIPTQTPLEAITPAKNSKWHWDSFRLAPCILPPGVVLRSETGRCHIGQLPLVTPEQDLDSWAGRSRLLTCPTLELTTPTPSPSSTQSETSCRMPLSHLGVPKAHGNHGAPGSICIF